MGTGGTPQVSGDHRRLWEPPKFQEHFRTPFWEYREPPEGEVDACVVEAAKELLRLMADLRRYEPGLVTRRVMVCLRATAEAEHLHIAFLCSALACQLNGLDLQAEAEAFHRRALCMASKILGDDNPALAESMEFLSFSLYRQGNFKEAILLSTGALRLTQQAFGLIHPNTANCFANLATILESIGLADNAAEVREKGYMIMCFVKNPWALSINWDQAYVRKEWGPVVGDLVRLKFGENVKIITVNGECENDDRDKGEADAQIVGGQPGSSDEIVKSTQDKEVEDVRVGGGQSGSSEENIAVVTVVEGQPEPAIKCVEAGEEDHSATESHDIAHGNAVLRETQQEVPNDVKKQKHIIERSDTKRVMQKSQSNANNGGVAIEKTEKSVEAKPKGASRPNKRTASTQTDPELEYRTEIVEKWEEMARVTARRFGEAPDRGDSVCLSIPESDKGGKVALKAYLKDKISSNGRLGVLMENEDLDAIIDEILNALVEEIAKEELGERDGRSEDGAEISGVADGDEVFMGSVRDGHDAAAKLVKEPNKEREAGVTNPAMHGPFDRPVDSEETSDRIANDEGERGNGNESKIPSGGDGGKSLTTCEMPSPDVDEADVNCNEEHNAESDVGVNQTPRHKSVDPNAVYEERQGTDGVGCKERNECTVGVHKTAQHESVDHSVDCREAPKEIEDVEGQGNHEDEKSPVRKNGPGGCGGDGDDVCQGHVNGISSPDAWNNGTDSHQNTGNANGTSLLAGWDPNEHPWEDSDGSCGSQPVHVPWGSTGWSDGWCDSSLPNSWNEEECYRVNAADFNMDEKQTGWGTPREWLNLNGGYNGVRPGRGLKDGLWDECGPNWGFCDKIGNDEAAACDLGGKRDNVDENRPVPLHRDVKYDSWASSCKLYVPPHRRKSGS